MTGPVSRSAPSSSSQAAGEAGAAPPTATRQQRGRLRSVIGNVFLGLLGLAGAYIFASLALESARYIEYIAALALLIFAINRFMQAIKRIKR
ncbi:MAG TPA: hypothetical protein VHT70_02950 [Candidatus Saccharimonadales bacterium]|nr:hypothetical protein [Candidatus Saccharimonadales bacterium]